jgi:hypothetical protein
MDRMIKNQTDSEDKHTNLAIDSKRNGAPPYFRMNPETKEEIGLEEYLKLGKLEEYTQACIDGEEGQDTIRKVAEILVKGSCGPVCPFQMVSKFPHLCVFSRIC